MQKSVLGKQWIYKEPPERDILAVTQKFNLDPTLAHIVLNRCANIEEIDSYLNPTIKQTMKDPSILLDLDKGAERFLKAITQKEKITIYADYDVDGATSSALLIKYLEELGVESTLYIPDRIDEGYGAHPEAIQKLKDQDRSLIVMCDCGTTSYKALEHAKKINIDVIVIDHHTAEINLPPCYALINPKRIDQNDEGKDAFFDLCTAGLVFVFLAAINRLIKKGNNYTPPDLMPYLDIVALGTVSDVMPLKKLNRAFVKQGLKFINKRCNIGIKALLEASELKDKVYSYHLGFYLGPRINAGGRVGNAELGSKLLSSNNPYDAVEIAQKLNTYNLERQTIESIVLEQAINIIEKNNLNALPFILVGSNNWHPGVIGIVASRIKEKYNKPTIVITFDENGEGKGSGRSVPGIELGEIILQAVQKKILTKGGGHAMAIGISIDKANWDIFSKYLEEHLSEKMSEYTPTIKIDKILSIPGASIAFAKQLMQMEPFGQGNPTPKIKIETIYPKYITLINEKHLRILLEDEDKNTINAMAFNVVGTELESALNQKKHKLDVLGTLKYDTWNGKEKVTLFIEDCYLHNFS